MYLTPIQLKQLKGLCSAPEELWPLFNRQYGRKDQDQANLRDKNCVIVTGFMETNLPKFKQLNGMQMLIMLSTLLNIYLDVDFTSLKPNQKHVLLKQVLDTNDMNSLDVLKPLNDMLKANGLSKTYYKTPFYLGGPRSQTNYIAFCRLLAIIKSLPFNESTTFGETNHTYSLTASKFLVIMKGMLGIDIDIGAYNINKVGSADFSDSDEESNSDISELEVAKVYQDDNYGVMGTGGFTMTPRGTVIHQVSELLRRDGLLLVLRMYDELLSFIRNESNSVDKKLDAIFLLTFLFGSSPILYQGRGGAFLTDVLFEYLLAACKLPFVRKNYLNLLEIELLYCYKSDDPNNWETPRKAYYQAINQNVTNEYFHPQMAHPIALREFIKDFKLNSAYKTLETRMIEVF